MNCIGDLQPYEVGAPRVGMITQWVDEKGFGWIESGQKRFFVHIKDFDRGQRRPKTGEEVRFIPGTDPKGRGCAKRVTFVKGDGDDGKFRGRKRVSGWDLLLLTLMLPLLALPLFALLWLPVPWWMGAGWMAVISAIAYGMYGDDKRRAVSGAWRVPESSLHFAEVLGGWPGAFLAQRWLRHKCRKPGYQVVFWSIVILYQVAAVDVILEQRLSRAVIGFLNR